MELARLLRCQLWPHHLSNEAISPAQPQRDWKKRSVFLPDKHWAVCALEASLFLSESLQHTHTHRSRAQRRAIVGSDGAGAGGWVFFFFWMLAEIRFQLLGSTVRGGWLHTGVVRYQVRIIPPYLGLDTSGVRLMEVKANLAAGVAAVWCRAALKRLKKGSCWRWWMSFWWGGKNFTVPLLFLLFCRDFWTGSCRDKWGYSNHGSSVFPHVH